MKDSLLITQKPKSPFLRNFISYYYFHKSGDEDVSLSFNYYPHFKNALTIYKKSKVEIIGETHTRSIPAKNDYFFSYSQLIKRFGTAEIIPPFDKIGVVFEPLGLNHFVKENLSHYLNEPINLNFNYFRDSMSNVLEDIFSAVDSDTKTTLLDTYFSERFIGFDEDRLKAAITFMLNSDTKCSVNSIAEELNMNRKTLLRLFNRHLKCSVKDYIDLIKFRRAVDVYQKSFDKPSLTNLALDLNYYDQAEFTNHFKKVTGVNPKKFYNNLMQFGSDSTYWSVNN